MSAVALKFPWSRKDAHDDDPYWDFFISTPPADLTNTVTELIRNAPAGNVFPTPADIHTPEITAQHVKELARYLGAELVGIAKLETDSALNPDSYPFAVLCAVRAEYDPRQARGIGGQVPVQNGLFITFVLSAWIRELGFRAMAVPIAERDRLAVRAGLGTIGKDGKLTTRKFGSRIYVADVIATDLPVAPDG